MAVAADDHKLRIRSFLFSEPDQIQPIISRHPDVRDHDIRMNFLYLFQRIDPVLRDRSDLHIKSIPVHQLFDQLADLALIIRDQYL